MEAGLFPRNPRFLFLLLGRDGHFSTTDELFWESLISNSLDLFWIKTFGGKLVTVGRGLVCVAQETTSTKPLLDLNFGTIDPAVEGLSSRPLILGLRIHGLGISPVSSYNGTSPRTSLDASDRVDGRELTTDGV